jgi:hypothetical protein
MPDRLSPRWRRLIRWRVLRWPILGSVLMMVWACNTRTLEAPTITPTATTQNTFQETANRKIDIVFAIDDSTSMAPSQANIVKNLPAFMDVLKNLPGGLPDLHIAVVSQDLGAGDGEIVGCDANGGDKGVFHYSPTGSCTATNLQSGATYISAPIGGNPNFTGDITSVFQCIAELGDQGCGFEHQIASVVRSLGADGSGPPQENQGFLRPEAYLAIVFLTNEDDCSAPQGSPVFTVSTQLNSMYGPTGNFICNEWGHLCSSNGGPMMKPSRFSPNPADLTTTVPYDNCVSAEGQGLLTPVGTMAQGIKALKTDPASQILVAAITGPAQPYVVQWAAPPVADSGPWPFIQHSCGSSNDPAGFADPGVRMQQFVEEFGGNGLIYPFCSTNYAPALQTIAQKLSALIGPSCITGTVANRPGSSTPDCTVTEVSPDPSDPTKNIQAVIPACADNGNAAPCWSLDPPGAMSSCAAGSHVVNINRGGQMAPDNTRNIVGCSMCIAGLSDPSRGCP